nr:hypothetical protein [Amycolatopsis thermoflava]
METKIDERQVLMAVLDQDRGLLHERPGLLIRQTRATSPESWTPT